MPAEPVALPDRSRSVSGFNSGCSTGRPRTVLATERAGPLVAAEGARLELGDSRVRVAASMLKGRWYEALPIGCKRTKARLGDRPNTHDAAIVGKPCMQSGFHPRKLRLAASLAVMQQPEPPSK